MYYETSDKAKIKKLADAGLTPFAIVNDTVHRYKKKSAEKVLKKSATNSPSNNSSTTTSTR